ncbi:hypothetical protein [Staphylococcus pasteuri]|uniref:hypothetical protein n=1 Tax=Staphylococcus pasteuri TaxID=45972 RepID=UPI003260170A
MNRLLGTLLLFIMFAFGISLQIKMNIGQSVFNAFSLSIAKYFDLKIGLVINLCNLILFCIYIIIKKSVKITDLSQFVFIMINGFLVDIFLEKVLYVLNIEVYPLKLIIFIVGVVIAAISLGQIIRLGIVKFPLENLCLVISEKYKVSFGLIRYEFDLIFIIGVVTLFIFNHNIMTIREGTIISFFLLSYLINQSYKFSFGKRK